MPNFRLTDASDSGDLGIHLAIGLHRRLPKHKPGNADSRQGTIRNARLPRLPLHRRRRPDAGRNVRGESDARGREGELRLSGPLDSQRARAHASLLSYEKKDIGPEDYAKKSLPYVFDLEHSQCPNDGHELQVQNMTVMPSLRLSVRKTRRTSPHT